jgi:hypothetical protein
MELIEVPLRYILAPEVVLTDFDSQKLTQGNSILMGEMAKYEAVKKAKFCFPLAFHIPFHFSPPFKMDSEGMNRHFAEKPDVSTPPPQTYLDFRIDPFTQSHFSRHRNLPWNPGDRMRLRSVSFSRSQR